MTQHDEALALAGEFVSVISEIRATIGSGFLPEAQQLHVERLFKDMGSARDRLVALLRESE